MAGPRASRAGGGYVVEGFRDLLKLGTIVTAIAVGLVLAQPADAER
ncbi:hypothetical protein ACICHK_21070 [Streptomyces sp. AHU1]